MIQFAMCSPFSAEEGMILTGVMKKMRLIRDYLSGSQSCWNTGITWDTLKPHPLLHPWEILVYGPGLLPGHRDLKTKQTNKQIYKNLPDNPNMQPEL